MEYCLNNTFKNKLMLIHIIKTCYYSNEGCPGAKVPSYLVAARSTHRKDPGILLPPQTIFCLGSLADL